MSVEDFSEKRRLIEAFDWLLAAVQRRCGEGTDLSSAGTTAQRRFEYAEGLSASISSWMSLGGFDLNGGVEMSSRHLTKEMVPI